MLDWMKERLRVEDCRQLGNVARDKKNGKREHRHDSSTVFDAMTLEEEEDKSKAGTSNFQELLNNSYSVFVH